MKKHVFAIAGYFAAAIIALDAWAGGVKTTDTSPGTQAPVGAPCSLKPPDGNSWEKRKADYEKCVQEKMGPEYDKTAKQIVKEQGAYERANAAADRAKIYEGSAREVFVRSHMEAEGVHRR